MALLSLVAPPKNTKIAGKERLPSALRSTAADSKVDRQALRKWAISKAGAKSKFQKAATTTPAGNNALAIEKQATGTKRAAIPQTVKVKGNQVLGNGATPDYEAGLEMTPPQSGDPMSQ